MSVWGLVEWVNGGQISYGSSCFLARVIVYVMFCEINMSHKKHLLIQPIPEI